MLQVCSLLHLEQPLLPKRPVGSRFLQMLDVCERLDVLFDPLIVFQFAFLQPAELHKHRYVTSFPRNQRFILGI